MIYTLTLNPAIDYVMNVDNLTLGKINRARREQVFYGGKGINVSLVLRELGVPSVATGFIAGFTGDALAEGISGGGLTSDFLRLTTGLTRINVKLRSGIETDVNGCGPDVSEDDVRRLLEKLSSLTEGDILVLAGSIPGTLPADIYERIMASLSPRGVKFALDAEGELLTRCLRFSPLVIKPNVDELEGVFGTRINSFSEAFANSEELRRMGAVNVLVSMGAEGATLLDGDGCRHEICAHEVSARNTVGAGDSMLAGFLAGLTETGDYRYALRLGNAAGGAAAACDGLPTREMILGLMEKHNGEK